MQLTRYNILTKFVEYHHEINNTFKKHYPKRSCSVVFSAI